jgi:hypothetical protein
VAHCVGGIVLKHVCRFYDALYNYSNFGGKALITSNLATSHHLPDYQAIGLSTYGILFLGTPHQGADGADLALCLLRIQSIYTQTNDAILQHLRRDSEFLQAQISQYASISGTLDTKFFYEVYPTQVLGGMQRLVCYLSPS